MTTATAPSTRIYNFSAGPGVLPEPVLRQAREDVWNIGNSGAGILEHSHRGPVFDRVIAEAEATCRKLGNIGGDYAVLFLQGGATLQFAMLPMSFLGEGQTADYTDTGIWTGKAIGEARKLGRVNVAFDGSACGYDHAPEDDELSLTDGAAYLHYCSNNTIRGTRHHRPPRTSAPLFCDASSEMFSRPLDITAHAVIYAGAQKNLGPAGCTLVILRKDMLERARPNLPVMLDYRAQVEQGSRLNTPPVFSIYVMGLVLQWILEKGGLAAMEVHNEKKARIVYEAIDGSDFYQHVARKDSRSRMNIPFRTPSEELDRRFVDEAEGHGMSGLKGHRSVGGMRASIYNAFPVEGCEALADFMSDFAARYG